MKIKDPLLLNLPIPIYTKRLLIRPLMPDDGQQLFTAIEETREQLIENLTDDELALGRRYVRFGDEEMSADDVRW
jgi:hypothetical protein